MKVSTSTRGSVSPARTLAGLCFHGGLLLAVVGISRPVYMEYVLKVDPGIVDRAFTKGVFVSLIGLAIAGCVVILDGIYDRRSLRDDGKPSDGTEGSLDPDAVCPYSSEMCGHGCSNC